MRTHEKSSDKVGTGALRRPRRRAQRQATERICKTDPLDKSLRPLERGRGQRSAMSLPLEAFSTCARYAFTLIELLVVIAIIGILAALLLPTLSRMKQRSQGIQCVNNLRQMQAAWTLYADDFQQTLVPNPGMYQPEYKANQAWVVGDVSDLPDETNTALLSQALLGPYAKNVSVYKCPTDPGYPRGTLRVRSISMNSYMHGKGGGLSQNFVMNQRLTDIRGPSSSFVFLDERSTSIDDGYFVMLLTTNYADINTENLPACYHNNAGGFSFADGHALLKKWRTAAFETAEKEVSIPNNVDYVWLMQNTTVPTTDSWP